MKLETLQSLVEALPQYGQRPAVGLRREYGAYWWSYQRLYQETHLVANFLQQQGLKPGDHLILWAPNSPEWVSFLFGAALCGVIVVPSDSDASPQRVLALAQLVNAVLLIYGVEQDISTFTIPTQSIYLARQPEALMAVPSASVPVTPDMPALIIFTSGTTAEPRGVVLTHRNLIAQIEQFRAWRWLVWILPCQFLVLSPLSHVQGLVMGICIPLAIGLSVLYSDSVNPAHIIRTIKQNQVALLLAVPQVQHLLLETLQQMPYNDQGVTLLEKARAITFFPWRRHILFLATRAKLGYQFVALLVGGATLSQDDERFWFECGYFLVQGYGLTETTAIASVNVNTPFFKRLGSIGKALRNRTIQLSDDGEILIKRTSTTATYFRNAATPAPIVDSAQAFFATGDLARQDAKGNLYFLGRKKDVIVTSEGHNVYPHEVENVLRQISGVRDVVVIGLSHNGHEEVHAVIQPEVAGRIAAIIKQANAYLEPHQMIRSWTIWTDGDFPRTELMKVKRREIVEIITQRQATAVSRTPLHQAAPTLDLIRATGDRQERLELIACYLKQMPTETGPQAQTTFITDLGLSSLDIIELLTLLEKKYAVNLTDAVVAEDMPLADIQKLVNAPNQGKIPVEFTKAPPKMDNPLFNLPRSILPPVMIPQWLSLCTRLMVTGSEYLTDLHPPFILAGAHHQHGTDVLLIYTALPRRLRRKLLIVTSHWLFSDYLNPADNITWSDQWRSKFSYYVGIPMFFPFTLWPHYGTTREGLYETCRLVNAGYSPVVFPEGSPFASGYAIQPGIGLVATQTQVPVLPLRLEGNEHLSFRPQQPRGQVTVHFSQPILVQAHTTPAEVSSRLQEAFRNMH